MKINKRIIIPLIAVIVVGSISLLALYSYRNGDESMPLNKNSEIITTFPSSPTPLYEGEVKLEFVGESTASFESEMKRVIIDAEPSLEEAKAVFSTWRFIASSVNQRSYEKSDGITFPTIDYETANVLLSYGRKMEKFECKDTRSAVGARPEAGYNSQGHAYMSAEYYPETAFIYTIPKIGIFNPVDYLMSVQDTYTIVEETEQPE